MNLSSTHLGSKNILRRSQLILAFEVFFFFFNGDDWFHILLLLPYPNTRADPSCQIGSNEVNLMYICAAHVRMYHRDWKRGRRQVVTEKENGGLESCVWGVALFRSNGVIIIESVLTNRHLVVTIEAWSLKALTDVLDSRGRTAEWKQRRLSDSGPG